LRAAISIGTIKKPIAVASCMKAFALELNSPFSGASKITAGIPSTIPVPIARSTPRTAAPGPQFEYGKLRFAGTVASMTPPVSQVSRSTKTRLRFLRRLLFLVAFLVIAAIALSQFTELKRLATGILASTAVLAAIVGFASQHTIANVVAGVMLAITQPIKIGDRIEFDDVEGRVTDITLSYTYVDPGDGSAIVIPNQLLVEGVVHNRSTGDTQG